MGRPWPWAMPLGMSRCHDIRADSRLARRSTQSQTPPPTHMAVAVRRRVLALPRLIADILGDAGGAARAQTGAHGSTDITDCAATAAAAAASSAARQSPSRSSQWRAAGPAPSTADPAAPVVVRGWVRSHRALKTMSFLALSDGSCQESLQVVWQQAELPVAALGSSGTLRTGTAVQVTGSLVPSSGKQAIELHATGIEVSVCVGLHGVCLAQDLL